MTVKQLITSLQMINEPDSEIRIRVTGRHIGGTPGVGARSIYNGFDWDNGKVYLIPEKPLTAKEPKV